jgi:hypothetical protein
LIRQACIAILFALSLVGADLPAVKSEPNLEKRSEKALENANRAINDARAAYKLSDLKLFRELLTEIKESLELSYDSLEETGKAARRSPKYFKRAEMKMHDIARRLDVLAAEVDIAERPEVEAVKKIASDLEDKLLLEIMTKKH